MKVPKEDGLLTVWLGAVWAATVACHRASNIALCHLQKQIIVVCLGNI